MTGKEIVMKNVLKKATATVLSATALIVSTVGISAYAADNSEILPFSTELLGESESSVLSTSSGSFPFALNNTNEVFQMEIKGTSSSAGNFTFSTSPSGGSVTIIIKDGNGNIITDGIFDTGGHAPSLGVSVPAGETYYVYMYSSSASSRNPVTGTVYYTKNVV